MEEITPRTNFGAEYLCNIPKVLICSLKIVYWLVSKNKVEMILKIPKYKRYLSHTLLRSSLKINISPIGTNENKYLYPKLEAVVCHKRTVPIGKIKIANKIKQFKNSLL